MTLVDDTWERQSLNTAPTAYASASYRSGGAYFEALDITAAALATFMLLAPLTVSAFGLG